MAITKKSEMVLNVHPEREMTPEEVEATAMMLFKWWRRELGSSLTGSRGEDDQQGNHDNSTERTSNEQD